MKLVDLHADLGYAVYQAYLKNDNSSLAFHHYEKRKDAEFFCICMASYFEKDESWEFMKETIQTLHEELKSTSDKFHLCKEKKDLSINDKILSILTVEGLCGIHSDVEEKVQWLVEHDIHMASLTWNYDTPLASGALTTCDCGLTQLGIETVKMFEKYGIILDLAHASKKTFWDAVALQNRPFLVSHANIDAIYSHPRNLDDDQLKAIKDYQGLIGICGAKNFVGKHPSSCDDLIQHIYHIIDVIGIDYISLGFDFMDDFENGEQYMLPGLENPRLAQNIISSLVNSGFQKEEIEKIAYKNAIRFLSNNLR